MVPEGDSACEPQEAGPPQDAGTSPIEPEEAGAEEVGTSAFEPQEAGAPEEAEALEEAVAPEQGEFCDLLGKLSCVGQTHFFGPRAFIASMDGRDHKDLFALLGKSLVLVCCLDKFVARPLPDEVSELHLPVNTLFRNCTEGNLLQLFKTFAEIDALTGPFHAAVFWCDRGHLWSPAAVVAYLFWRNPEAPIKDYLEVCKVHHLAIELDGSDHRWLPNLSGFLNDFEAYILQARAFLRYTKTLESQKNPGYTGRLHF